MLSIEPVAAASAAAAAVSGALAAGSSLIGSVFGATAAAGVPAEVGNTTVHGITDKLTTAATSAATQSAGLAQFIKTQLNNIKMMMINLGNQARIEAQTAVRNARQAVKDRALKAVDDARNMVKQIRTFKFWWKMIRKFFRFMKYAIMLGIIFRNIGLWAVRVVEVIIYRIFTFKDCFLWYLLEIVGFVLYTPVEFVVWLLCLQSLEKSLWGAAEELDCMFADMTGYHLLHYSDTILKKCYAMQFPPFPMGLLPTESGGEITEASMIRFLIAWFMPPTPGEIADVLHLIIQSMRESGPIVQDAAAEFIDEVGEMFKVEHGSEKSQVAGSAGDMVSM